MFVVDVIPIGRGVSIGSLSYFSSEQYERGTIVTIPVRNKMMSAVVMRAVEASATKTALRAATFSLKRLPEQERLTSLPPSFMAAVDALAEYYATQPGAVLFSLLPTEIRNGTIPLPFTTIEQQRVHVTPEIFQATVEDRSVSYRSIVRQAFANNTSVIVVTPSGGDVDRITNLLSTGIKKHVIVLNRAIGVRELRKSYERIADMSHPVVIIASPQYAFIERSDISTIILERSRGNGYRSSQRPYIDFLHALEVHSSICGRRVIIADTIIRTEDEWRLRNDLAQPLEEHPKRLALPGTLSVRHMLDTSDGVAFPLFSEELVTTILKTIDKKERVFLFAARRGLAPIVACVDCGHIIRSPESGAPMSLHRKMVNGLEERYFVCNVSGQKTKAKDLCPQCGSWRLRERGIGVQQMYDELKKMLPEEHLILFDHTTANTPKKADQLITSFYDTKKSIMVGTALALPYLTKLVETSAVLSMDSLRAIPSWRQQEELFSTILTLREKTSGTVLVQTRTTADDEMLKHAAKGDTSWFYGEELAAREACTYPPYFVFIHLTWTCPEGADDTLARDVEERLAQFEPHIYEAPAYNGTKRTRYALIRVPQAAWPDDLLVDAVRSLPPSVRVIINPNRIV